MSEYSHPYADQSHLEIRSSVLKKRDEDREWDQTEWHWTLVHDNGKVVAIAGETYVDKSHAQEMANKLFPGIMVLPHTNPPKAN